MILCYLCVFLPSYQHPAVAAELACEMELHERLSCLLAELEPYEQKLIQLNKKMKIKLRKEHENYTEEPPDKQQVKIATYYYTF